MRGIGRSWDTMFYIDWQQRPGRVCAAGAGRGGYCLCLGRFRGWVHPQHVPRELGSCTLPLASPRTVLIVILKGEYWSSFEPLLHKLLGSLWNGFDSPERPLHTCSEFCSERRRRWLLSGTCPAALCPTPASNGINDVLSQSLMEQPRMQLPRHPPTVPVPPGMAAPSPPLSSIVGRTQPKPLCDGKFSCEVTFWVHEQCGTYVCLLNTKRDFYRL